MRASPPQSNGPSYAHGPTLVDIHVREGEFHVDDQVGERQAVIPRASGREVTGSGATVCATESASQPHVSMLALIWFSVSSDRLGYDHRWDGPCAAGDDRLAAHGSGRTGHRLLAL